MTAWIELTWGLFLLLVGAEVLVRGGVSLGQLLKVSPTVIGLTVVAIGTSLPELIIGVKDTIDGQGNIGVAGVLGSNIFNIGGILGLCAFIYPVRVDALTLRFEYPPLVVVTLAMFFLTRDAVLVQQEGLILIACAVFFIIALIVRIRHANALKAAEAAARGQEFQTAAPLSEGLLEEGVPFSFTAVLKILVMVSLGCFMLYYGADYSLEGARSLARGWGWSEHLIGLTIVAFGTSAPELAVSMVAAFRKQTDLAIGNVIGSCIFNLAFVLGIVSGLGDLTLDPDAANRDLYWNFGFVFALAPLMFFGRVLSRFDGLILFAGFATYYFLILR